MTLGRGLPGAVVTAGWATIGLLVSHVAAYDVVYPDGHVHAAALDASGHGWLIAMGPTLGLAVLAVLAAALVGARSGRPRVARFRTLATIQVGAFVAIEVGERLATGLTPVEVGHQFVDHGLGLVLLTGMLIQLITAWLGSAVSRGIADATRATRAAPSHATGRAPMLVIGVEGAHDRRPSLLRGSRAPPGPIPSRCSI